MEHADDLFDHFEVLVLTLHPLVEARDQSRPHFFARYRCEVRVRFDERLESWQTPHRSRVAEFGARRLRLTCSCVGDHDGVPEILSRKLS